MDMINPNDVVWHQCPNPGAWPITKRLDGVEFSDRDTTTGVRPLTDAQSWPEVTPTGWAGPITYSIWLLRRHQGVWHGACLLEFFRGKDWTGAPLSHYYSDWVNTDKDYGVMNDLGNVQDGETIGFMLSAGSFRFKNTATQPGQRSPLERTRIIVVPFQRNGYARVSSTTPDPRPEPKPDPRPDPTPVIDPGMARAIVDLTAEIATLRAEVRTLQASPIPSQDWIDAVQSRLAACEARDVPALPSALSFRVFGVPLTVPVTWRS